MKAEQARILTNESLNSKYQELEQHPEYLDICDKIRAAATRGECSITVEIFTKDIIWLLARGSFEVKEFNGIKDHYEISW